MPYGRQYQSGYGTLGAGVGGALGKLVMWLLTKPAKEKQELMKKFQAEYERAQLTGERAGMIEMAQRKPEGARRWEEKEGKAWPGPSEGFYGVPGIEAPKTMDVRGAAVKTPPSAEAAQRAKPIPMPTTAQGINIRALFEQAKGKTLFPQVPDMAERAQFQQLYRGATEEQQMEYMQDETKLPGMPTYIPPTTTPVTPAGLETLTELGVPVGAYTEYQRTGKLGVTPKKKEEKPDLPNLPSAVLPLMIDFHDIPIDKAARLWRSGDLGGLSKYPKRSVPMSQMSDKDIDRPDIYKVEKYMDVFAIEGFEGEEAFETYKQTGRILPGVVPRTKEEDELLTMPEKRYGDLIVQGARAMDVPADRKTVAIGLHADMAGAVLPDEIETQYTAMYDAFIKWQNKNDELKAMKALFMAAKGNKAMQEEIGEQIAAIVWPDLEWKTHKTMLMRFIEGISTYGGGQVVAPTMEELRERK